MKHICITETTKLEILKIAIDQTFPSKDNKAIKARYNELMSIIDPPLSLPVTEDTQDRNLP